MQSDNAYTVWCGLPVFFRRGVTKICMNSTNYTHVLRRLPGSGSTGVNTGTDGTWLRFSECQYGRSEVPRKITSWHVCDRRNFTKKRHGSLGNVDITRFVFTNFEGNNYGISSGDDEGNCVYNWTGRERSQHKYIADIAGVRLIKTIETWKGGLESKVWSSSVNGWRGIVQIWG